MYWIELDNIAKQIIKDHLIPCRDCQDGAYFTRKCWRCGGTGIEIAPSINKLLPEICKAAGIPELEIKYKTQKAEKTDL